MSRRVRSNIAVPTTLTAGASDSDTTLTVGSTTGWPTPGTGEVAVACIRPEDAANREIVTYTGLTSTTLTGVVRGRDGTTARSHSSGAAVEHVVSAAEIERGWKRIALATLGSAAAAIGFSNLSTDFVAFRLTILEMRTVSGVSVHTLEIQFNADTGSNYTHARVGVNSAPSALNAGGAGVSSINLGTIAGGTTASNRNVAGQLIVTNPAAAIHRVLSGTLTSQNSGTNEVRTWAVGGAWMSTSRITSMSLFNAVNFEAGTTVLLEGLVV